MRILFNMMMINFQVNLKLFSADFFLLLLRVKPQLSFATTTTAKSQFASSLFLHKIPHRTLCYHCSQVILPSSSTIFCYVCKLFLHNYCYNGDDKCVFFLTCISIFK